MLPPLPMDEPERFCITMSTKQRHLSQATASKSGGEEDDIGALIYRESQLRKKEAAAAAARSGKNSSAPMRTRHRHAAATAAVRGDESSPRGLLVERWLQPRGSDPIRLVPRTMKEKSQLKELLGRGANMNALLRDAQIMS